MAKNTNTQTGERSDRSKSRLGKYVPTVRGAYNGNASQAIEDAQADSSSTILAPEPTMMSLRKISAAAHKDVDAEAVGIDDDGLGWSAFIAKSASRAADDIGENIRHFYSTTLPVVTDIFAIARKLRGGMPDDAPAIGGAGPRQRRLQDEANASAAAAKAEYAAGYDELSAFLNTYKTRLNDLEGRRQHCLCIYKDTVGAYMEEALRYGRSWLAFLPWRKRIQAGASGIANLHFQNVPEPKMPIDIFEGMSLEDVIEHIDELRIPTEYAAYAA